jgi:tRNA pseudouridine synthase 10
LDPERIESSPLIEAMMNSPEPKGTAPAMADGAKIFIEGRYRKLVRDLPQTLFYCPKCKGHPRRRKGCETCEGFGKLTRDSVQELVAWVIGKAFGTRKNKFHGAGREDMDVCMLGDGRPFILELANPKTYGLDLAELEAEVNSRNAGRIEVLGLHYSKKARVVVLKEEKHAKEYGARVAVEGDVEVACERLQAKLGERVNMVQRTPERVAHRRADLNRERWIELTSAKVNAEGQLEISLLCEHGAYVKEAISGEDGRTSPNLAEWIDMQCRCVELDVLGIRGSEGEFTKEEPTFRAPFGTGL